MFESREEPVAPSNSPRWNGTILPDEIVMTATASSGPGGQGVNTTNSNVTLSWNITTSQSISFEEMERLLKSPLLKNRISKEGILSVSSQQTRSQTQNRVLANKRLHELVSKAIEVPKERKQSKVPRRAKEARLKEKKHHSSKKQSRSNRNDE